LYHDDIIVCDISGRNANVMFELGMRLAFNKPFVIINDDISQAPFDMANIENILYPKDLNYMKVHEFKRKLLEKVNCTLEKSRGKDYSILKEFGKFEKIRLPEDSDKNADFNKVLNGIVDNIGEIKTALRHQEMLMERRSTMSGEPLYRRSYHPELEEAMVVIRDIARREPILLEMLKHNDVSAAISFVRGKSGLRLPSFVIEKALLDFRRMGL
jgi:hypothetical protein